LLGRTRRRVLRGAALRQRRKRHEQS
jgi:hypothetical protein